MSEEVKKNLVLKRGQCKSNLTRYTNFVNDICNHNKITEIKIRTEKIEFDFEKFSNIQSDLEILESETEIDEREEYENKYFNSVALAKQLIQDCESHHRHSLKQHKRI